MGSHIDLEYFHLCGFSTFGEETVLEARAESDVLLGDNGGCKFADRCFCCLVWLKRPWHTEFQCYLGVHTDSMLLNLDSSGFYLDSTCELPSLPAWCQQEPETTDP